MESYTHWLMKAEPDSRLEKGVDVKFSIDDLRSMGTSQWDGVRNHEAKNIMKSKMKLGHRVLFYHSNCKVPGIYGLAEISKEGYPDYTAWDPTHPYFHASSRESNPTWFMVDVTYKSHIENPVTLSLLKTLATLAELPECISYIGSDGLKAISGMVLVNRGRLSVQPVTPEAYEAIILLGSKGGWAELEPQKTKSSLKRKADETVSDFGDPIDGRVRKSARKAKKKVRISEAGPGSPVQVNSGKVEPKSSGSRQGKAKAKHTKEEEESELSSLSDEDSSEVSATVASKKKLAKRYEVPLRRSGRVRA